MMMGDVYADCKRAARPATQAAVRGQAGGISRTIVSAQDYNQVRR
jgi:hypothetical protein